MAASPKRVPRPDHVFIGNDTYSIEWLTEEEWQQRKYNTDAAAETHSELSLIVMRLQPGKREQRYHEHLWHEITHACWDLTALAHTNWDDIKAENLEEHIVVVQAPAQLFVLTKNPHVVAWLLSDGTDIR